ncbi:hypothetical protein ACJMK2_042728 [Sinanodonta woodiana]|uniref:Profilin n=1 Tax=Sinanodonta woodiana TaxID=1069815 RepID=A0ABD3W8B6_SINWO
MTTDVAIRHDTTLREEYLMKLWNNYINDNLVDSTPCRLAIFDLKTKRLIVCSEGMIVKNNELEEMIEGCTYPEVAYRNGIYVNGHHYDVKLADGKNGIFARDGLCGCTVCRSYALLLVGIHDERVKAEVCNEEIMKLGDYFRKLGL